MANISDQDGMVEVAAVAGMVVIGLGIVLKLLKKR
jgi:hypothetical protein